MDKKELAGCWRALESGLYKEWMRIIMQEENMLVLSLELDRPDDFITITGPCTLKVGKDRRHSVNRWINVYLDAPKSTIIKRNLIRNNKTGALDTKGRDG